jgi:alpha-beta hydrolase superfamily lysophospholipase
MIRAIIILALLLLSACASTPATAPVASIPASAEAVQLTTSAGEVYGTLLVPSRGTATVPVALLVAGSGPTDRDGNNAGIPGANNSLRFLAETLAANGIASLRYDKRGIAASAAAAASEADLRFDHFVSDATEWVRQLRKDPRFTSVTVIGHSEGSLIGMLAARSAGADAFVSIAGISRSAPEILREQLRPQLPAELWSASERILASLTAGDTTADVPPELAALYRPSVQPYLISWFAYDPSVEMGRLTMPVLILQGDTDIQVPTKDAEALHRAAPHAEIAIIDGMNHVLKTVEDDRTKQIASYSDPDLPLAPELGTRIVAFIQRL